MNEIVRVPIHIHALGETDGTRTNEPVTVGVPFPRGAAHSLENWILSSGAGPLEVQTQVQERWPDGSVRWALLDFQATLPHGASQIAMDFTQAPALDGEWRGLRLESTGQRLQIDTGACTVLLDPGVSGLIATVGANGDPVLAPGASSLGVRGAAPEPWPVTWERPSIESQGPLRATVTTRGTVSKGPTGLDLTHRIDCYAGSPTLRIRLTVRNPSRAEHRGGIWELGDSGSRLIKELALSFQCGAGPNRPSIRYSLERDAPFDDCATRVRVYQDSSGGENWQSTNHVNRDGVVPLRFRGYQAQVDGQARQGLRATPIVAIEDGPRSVALAVPQFWENFPAAVDVNDRTVSVSFWPAESSDLHELQGGEQKTFECFVTFGPGAAEATRWCRSRLLAHSTPAWYAQSRALPFLVPEANDDHETYKTLVNAAIEGSDTFFDKRERVDEFGWRNFGDIYGDHEAVFHQGPAPLVSHHNNQYDPIGGFLYQFLRSGDERWWSQTRDCARHVSDIDLYHTTEDHAKYNHGLFWHTFHYVDAGKSSHRSYPSGTNGGGPSSEHNYTSGLMLHYLMTGDVASREAALDLAQFVIDIDDGTKTVFRWLDRGFTGVASASRTPYYHGPGRGSGNSLNALVDGHRLTGERRFLDKAEQIIRRCTHPLQDLAALTLLDPENRWFYTIFLQSLGKYLDYKVHLGELDAMYGYGRAVLLHFARWMAANERPYLDHQELLEFPTETWAAQDVRKSEVFDHASRHASAAERQNFLERAEFFHRYSLETLASMPTRSVARPVVLLLAYGFMRAYVKTHDERLPEATADWSAIWPWPVPFAPQRARARRRAVAVAIAGALAITALLMWLV